MSITVRNTLGNIIAIVEESEINDFATSIRLLGKFSIDFGDILHENFIHILENFSNNTPPINPIEGQLWFNSNNNELNLRKNNEWIVLNDKSQNISTLFGGSTEPSDVVEGSLFWDTGNGKLRVYDDGKWLDLFPIQSNIVSRIQNPDNTIFVDTDLISNGVVFHNNTQNLIVSNTSSTFTSNLVLNSPNTDFEVTSKYIRQQTFVSQPLINTSANIQWNLDIHQSTSLLLNGNKTLQTPTNMKAGGVYILIVTQDAAGNRSLNFSSAYKFPTSGLKPDLATNPGGVTTYRFFCDGNSMYSVGDSKNIIPLVLNISSNTQNYNVRNQIINQFAWDQVTPISVTINVLSGVVVGSNSVNSYGMVISGTYPPNSEITLVNNGFIVGRGGNGGVGSSSTCQGGSGGTPGGPALQVTTPITIVNNGIIGGGGGGGGGGGDGGLYHAGGGGGGGAGNTIGSGGRRGIDRNSGRNGSSGTLLNGGAGGAGSLGGTGGRGGHLGQKGANGGFRSGSRGCWSRPGGAAGIAVQGNSLITWSPLGDVRGTRSG